MFSLLLKDYKQDEVYSEENFIVLKCKKYRENNKTFVNVAIASAITGWARIKMYKYLSLSGYQVQYTDTDSVFLDKALPDDMIGDDLGMMKFEGLYKEAIFVSPKVYGYMDDKGKEIIKFKGVDGENIKLGDQKSLLIKDSKYEVNNVRFKRTFDSVKIIDTKKKIEPHAQINNLKRIRVYDNNNTFTHTLPVILVNGERQNPKSEERSVVALKETQESNKKG